MNELEQCHKCGDWYYGKAILGHINECNGQPKGPIPTSKGGYASRDYVRDSMQKISGKMDRAWTPPEKTVTESDVFVEQKAAAATKSLFSLDTRDKNGVTGNSLLAMYANRSFEHTGNGKTYRVIGVSWMGELDSWGLVHESPEGVICTRSVLNFLGNRSNGDVRFVLKPVPVA